AVAMTSSINIGIRHVLPIYPLLAVVAGWWCGAALRLGRGGEEESVATHPGAGWKPAPHLSKHALVAVLLVWQLAGAVRAWPDYLAWFNAIAGDEPQEWLLDSNLDWGQDLLRLEEEARRRGIDRLALSYFGSALPARHDLPPLRPAHATRPTTGWIAVSWMNRKGIGLLSAEPLYRWLDPHEPVATIGKSILLYYIPEERE
ncbi:MAG TPA: hypothetical protein VM557_11050, partial [Thermoanaerobaculia bacterium]|nr:hypothetical protein [Thermoanaerobaculia bacterium]